MTIVNHNTFHYPGILIHGGKTYWHKETIMGMSKKDALFFMGADDVFVRSPIIDRRNRYAYGIYTLMWDYEVDIRPDRQSEGSIIMNKSGKKLEPIEEFYIPTDYACSHPYDHRLGKWWEK